MSAEILKAVLALPGGRLPLYFSKLAVHVEYSDAVDSVSIADDFELMEDWVYSGLSAALKAGWFSGEAFDRRNQADLKFSLDGRTLVIQGKFSAAHRNLLTALLRMIVFANHTPRDAYERAAREIGDEYTDVAHPVTFGQQVSKISVSWEAISTSVSLVEPSDFSTEGLLLPVFGEEGNLSDVYRGDNFDLDAESLSLNDEVETSFEAMTDAECFVSLSMLNEERDGDASLFMSSAERLRVEHFEGDGIGLVELAHVVTNGSANNASISAVE